MILHNVILAAGTIVYVIVMFLLARDFGQTPNHMALMTSEGAAVVLTILFVPTAVLAALSCVLTVIVPMQMHLRCAVDQSRYDAKDL